MNVDAIFTKPSGFKSVEMTTQLTPELRYTVQHYLYGRCHLFALAFQEVKKVEIVMFCHYACWQYFLRHAACVINDEFVIDASGIRTYQSVIDEYCVNSEDFNESMIQVIKGDKALDIIQSCTDTEYYKPFDANERSAILRYIEFMDSHKITQFP